MRLNNQNILRGCLSSPKEGVRIGYVDNRWTLGSGCGDNYEILCSHPSWNEFMELVAEHTDYVPEVLPRNLEVSIATLLNDTNQMVRVISLQNTSHIKWLFAQMSLALGNECTVRMWPTVLDISEKFAEPFWWWNLCLKSTQAVIIKTDSNDKLMCTENISEFSNLLDKIEVALENSCSLFFYPCSHS